MQYEQFFALRLAQLRSQKKVSAREMSLALGQNSSYINRIENGRSFPQMQNFFYICEYLNIPPAEFFDPSNKEPEHLDATYAALKKLSPARLALVSQLIDELSKAK